MGVKRRRAQLASPPADAPEAAAPRETSPDGDAAPEADDSPVQPLAEPMAAAAAAKVKPRAPAALAWMRAAGTVDAARVSPLADVPQLDARLQQTLRAAGIAELFPVQAAVWDALRGGHPEAHDLCIHAPTGSGKTLAYALPVVAALSGRVIRRLRALVVVPTHDLAQQARGARAARGWRSR